MLLTDVTAAAARVSARAPVTWREVLTFTPGTPAWPDQFHPLDDDVQLRRATRLVRDSHVAVAGFTAPPNARWQALTPADSDEIIAHHE